MTTLAPRTSQTMREIVADLAEELQLLNENPGALGLDSGIKSFDEKCRGAFAPGSVITLAGGSGGGKTAAIQQLALAHSSQCWVHVVTLEDQSIDTTKRMLANIARQDVGRIREGYAGTSIPVEVDKGLQALAETPIEVDEAAGIDIWKLVRRIGNRSLRENGEFGVVYIDQLSHISIPNKHHEVQAWAEKRGWKQPPAHNSAEYQRLEWIVELLQSVARHFGIAIVIAHQLNDLRDQEPTLENIRGSRGIVHKSETVLIFWVPSHLVQRNLCPGPGEPKEERIPNLLGKGFILVPKQRRGPKDVRLPVTFVGENQIFLDDEGLGQPFSLPAPRTEKAKEGSAKLSAFYKRRLQARAAREQEALAGPVAAPAAIAAAPSQSTQYGDEEPAWYGE